MSPHLVLSPSDVVGRDFYDFWLRMYKKVGFRAGDLDEICQLDHEQ